MRKRLLILCIASYIITAMFCTASAAASSHGGLRTIDLTGEAEFTFVPQSDGEFALYYFSATQGANVFGSISHRESVLCSGESGPRLCSARLQAGTKYIVKFSGAPGSTIEIAPVRLGSCHSKPLALQGNTSSRKTLSGERSAHWYAYTPESDGALRIEVSSESFATLTIHAYDEDGVQLGQTASVDAFTRACDVTAAAGREIRFRVGSSSGDSGSYRISLAEDQRTSAPTRILLDSEEMTFDGLEWQPLSYEFYPWGSCELVSIVSSNPSVVTVDRDGALQSVAPGRARIALYGWGGVRAEIDVKVNAVPVQSLTFETPTLLLNAGDAVPLGATLQPDNATDRALTFTSSDESLLTVDEDGTATAHAVGRATVTATTRDGLFRATQYVTIQGALPRYRALLIGEENYAEGVESVRAGSQASVNAVADALERLSFDGRAYAVRTLNDAPRDSIVSELRNAFREATDIDVSLVYITCHGVFGGGMTQLLLVDGSVLSAEELCAELSKVRGTVILMVDCCASGAFMGATREVNSLAADLDNLLPGDRFFVIASALTEQDSLRIGNESSMMTAFARAFSDASAFIGANAAADADRDGSVSYAELVRFLQKHVSAAARAAGAPEQVVCATNDADSFPFMDFSAGE